MSRRRHAPVEIAPDDVQKYLDAIFDLTPRRTLVPGAPRSLAEAIRLGIIPPDRIEEARRIVDSYPYPRRPATAIPARGLPYNNPGWDNVVRAAEEDR